MIAARACSLRMPILSANASHYLEWRDRCPSCEDIAAVRAVELTLRGGGDPQRVRAARASANLLPLLGARAQLGRLFTETEDAEGADRVVVLTDGFWRRQSHGTNLVNQPVAMRTAGHPLFGGTKSRA